MDTKWKRFSRNGIVKVVCNILLIGCIVLGAVFANQIQIYQSDYAKNTNGIRYPYELFGDTEFQEEVKERFYQVLHCMMANVEEDQDAKQLAEGLNEALQGMYNYNIVYTDTEGKQHEFSNCNSVDDISKDAIQIKYEGSMQGEIYDRNWDNVYFGTISYFDEEETYHSVDFEWLDVGALMQELVSEYPSHCDSIINELVNHLELYKDSLQRFLCYLATEENVPRHTAVEKSTYYKIYGCYPNYATLNFDEELSDYEYDEASGLYIDTYDGYYYNPETYEWYDEGTPEYEKYCNEMSKKIKSIQEVLNKENVQKTEDNVYKLTKTEKENLRKNISTSLKMGYYVENPGEVEQAQALEVSFPVSAMLKSPASYSIQFGVKKDYVQKRLETYYTSWEKERASITQLDKKIENCAIGLIVDAVCAGLLVLFLCYICGRKADTEEVQLVFFDHWKTEIMLLIGGGIIAGLFVGMYNSIYETEIVNGKNNGWVIFNLAEIGFCLWLLVQILFSLVRRKKAKTLYKNSVFALVMGRVQGRVNQGKLSRKMTLIMVLLFVVWIFLEVLTMKAVEAWDMGMAMFFMLLMIGMWLLIVAYINRTVRKLSVIIEGVKRIRGGDLTYQIPTDGKQNHLNQLTWDINCLSEGLERAVDDMLRSERLKTELISNVSHDIKTPLTSIITYVDLLKREEVQPEKAKEYVEVLDQKSQRLKILTDDLFEAAKASSGAMAAEITKIDIGALVCQAAGEFSEKFEKSELELKNSVQGNIWFVQADGRLAWRIVENLFANVTKYAQPNSRVYVDAEQKEQMIEIVVKNVSAYELNISAEELMERFTRGDKSRNTEGSGLGLNIAKSLAELQEGNFFVEIDGDLFKAILQLPIAQ